MKSATRCHKMPQVPAINHLNTLQLEAIELMLSGQTDTQIAKKISKSRDTVCRWRNHDPHFKKFLNQRRGQHWQNSTECLNRIVFRSLDLLEKALIQGDTKTASAILDILQEVKNDNTAENGVQGVS